MIERQQLIVLAISLVIGWSWCVTAVGLEATYRQAIASGPSVTCWRTAHGETLCKGEMQPPCSRWSGLAC